MVFGRGLSRREREIMEVLHREPGATAARVRECLEDPPSYSAVRALLAILVRKGRIRHEQDGPRYVYLPVEARQEAGRSALAEVVRTFFAGDSSLAISTLLSEEDLRLSDRDLEKLQEQISAAREREGSRGA